MRILLVDDEPDVHRLLTAALELSGVGEVVGVATDAEEAVDLARRLRPDAVVTDMVMGPTADGGYVSALRGMIPNARIVVFSGYVRPRGEPLPRGADEYVVKGGRLGRLVEALTRPASVPEAAPDLPVPRGARWEGGHAEVHSTPEHLTVAVAGDLDAHSGREVLGLVLAALDGGRRVQLDLGDVTFLDASGLRMIGLAREQAAAGPGSLEVVRASVVVRRVASLAGAADLVDGT